MTEVTMDSGVLGKKNEEVRDNPAKKGLNCVNEREKEMEFAEIELRLRRMVLELLRPTVKKTKELDYSAIEMTKNYEKIQEEMAEFKAEQSAIRSRVGNINTFHEMFDNEVKKRQLFSTKVEEKLITLSADVEAKMLHRTEQDFKLERKVDQMEEDHEAFMTSSAAQNEALDEQIKELSQQVFTTRQEHDVRIGDQDMELSNLTLKIFGSDGLSRKLQEDQKLARAEIEMVQKNISAIAARATKSFDLEDTIEDIRKQLADLETDQTNLAESCTNMFKNLKDDISQKGCQTASRTAIYMQKMRKEYQQELLECHGMREDLDKLKFQTQAISEELKKAVERAGTRTEESLRIARIDIDMLMNNREIEWLKEEINENIQKIYEKAEKAFSGTQSLANATIHITSVIKMIMEAAKLNYQMDDGVLDILITENVLKSDILKGDSVVKVLKELRWSLINQASLALNQGPAKMTTRLPSLGKPSPLPTSAYAGEMPKVLSAR